MKFCFSLINYVIWSREQYNVSFPNILTFLTQRCNYVDLYHNGACYCSVIKSGVAHAVPSSKPTTFKLLPLFFIFLPFYEEIKYKCWNNTELKFLTMAYSYRSHGHAWISVCSLKGFNSIQLQIIWSLGAKTASDQKACYVNSSVLRNHDFCILKSEVTALWIKKD